MTPLWGSNLSNRNTKTHTKRKRNACAPEMVVTSKLTSRTANGFCERNVLLASATWKTVQRGFYRSKRTTVCDDEVMATRRFLRPLLTRNLTGGSPMHTMSPSVPSCSNASRLILSSLLTSPTLSWTCTPPSLSPTKKKLWLNRQTESGVHVSGCVTSRGTIHQISTHIWIWDMNIADKSEGQYFFVAFAKLLFFFRNNVEMLLRCWKFFN